MSICLADNVIKVPHTLNTQEKLNFVLACAEIEKYIKK